MSTGRLVRFNGPGLDSVWVSHSALIIATEQVTVLKRWFLAKGVVFSNRPVKHSFRAQGHCAIAHNRNCPRPSTHTPSSLHSACLRCHYADPDWPLCQTEALEVWVQNLGCILTPRKDGVFQCSSGSSPGKRYRLRHLTLGSQR